MWDCASTKKLATFSSVFFETLLLFSKLSLFFHMWRNNIKILKRRWFILPFYNLQRRGLQSIPLQTRRCFQKQTFSWRTCLRNVTCCSGRPLSAVIMFYMRAVGRKHRAGGPTATPDVNVFWLFLWLFIVQYSVLFHELKVLLLPG